MKHYWVWDRHTRTGVVHGTDLTPSIQLKVTQHIASVKRNENF
jgi:hypothetical protein